LPLATHAKLDFVLVQEKQPEMDDMTRVCIIAQPLITPLLATTMNHYLSCHSVINDNRERDQCSGTKTGWSDEGASAIQSLLPSRNHLPWKFRLKPRRSVPFIQEKQPEIESAFGRESKSTCHLRTFLSHLYGGPRIKWIEAIAHARETDTAGTKAQ
jgi:hypothetical protein